MAGRITFFSLAVGSMAIVLAGCADQTAVSDDISSENWNSIASMSRSAGASATRINPQVGTVLYSGAPRDYIACSARGEPVDISQRSAVLDIRTTVAGAGEAVRLNTQYVVTATNSDAETRSIAFTDDSSATFEDGVRCSSTGNYEKRITGRS